MLTASAYDTAPLRRLARPAGGRRADCADAAEVVVERTANGGANTGRLELRQE